MRFAVMASGRGSNFQALIDAHARGELPGAELVQLIVNKRDAQAVARAKAAGIPWAFIDSEAMPRAEFDRRALAVLRDCGADAVVLAGFMRILKGEFLRAFEGRVVNVHPSLLPSFPGLEAWKQALDHGVKYAGVTVHYVDQGIDSGPIIEQEPVRVRGDDTPESLCARIQEVERVLYPKAISTVVERLRDEG